MVEPTLPDPAERLNEETHVNGVPHRLLDSYDGDGVPPSPECIQMMLDTAPEYIRERLIQVATERAALDFGTPSPEEALRLRLMQGMPAKWVLIENEGALVRGPARGVPREV